MATGAEITTEPSPAACQVSLLTPTGRGAVASVLVRGEHAVRHADAMFVSAARRPLPQFPEGRIVFGRWHSGQQAGEDVVVCRRGEREVEVHCHGGLLAARTIIDSLVARGCREVPWRALTPGQPNDPIATEARIALAAAPTERAAGVLLDQLRGALRDALFEVQAAIQAGDAGAAQQGVTKLLDYADLGLHLNQPWDVVLTGCANVGKSSLINALLGYQRCIVFEQPGTTRDVITAQTACDGWPVQLTDTAGLRNTDDAIEAEGVRRARDRLATADAIVLVFDASQAWCDADDELLRQWPDAIVVHNKCDTAEATRKIRPPGLSTCALDGVGVEQLLARLAQRLVPRQPRSGSAVPFTQRQVDALQGTCTALERGKWNRAREILRELMTQA